MRRIERTLWSTSPACLDAEAEALGSSYPQSEIARPTSQRGVKTRAPGTRRPVWPDIFAPDTTIHHMARLSVLGALALALALAACDSNDEPDTCSNESFEIAIDTLATGTCCATVVSTDRVRVNYVGTLEDGTEFDSGTNTIFSLAGTVSGFREGVTGMRIGERRRITVPPYRGYGVNARNDADGNEVIPACSVLIFEVELVDILS